MARNKPRLYLALYARPKYPGTYHYALFIGRKDLSFSSKSRQTSTIAKFHVKNTLQTIDGALVQPWVFEHTVMDLANEQRLLVLLAIGKALCSVGEIETVLRAVPIYQEDDADGEKAKEFNCRQWLRYAVEAVTEKRVVACRLEWEGIRDQAIKFVETKKEEGRWKVGWKGDADVPILSLVDG